MRIAILVLLGLIVLVVLREATRGRKPKEAIRWLLGFQERLPTDYPNVSITVIVPAYNEEKHIAQTIKSLQAQTRRPDRIIVVDDCSTDNTAKIAQELGCEVIRTPKNTGTKAQAQNYALQFVDSELLVTVDADTVLEERAIEKILPAFFDKEVATACGFVIPQEIKTLWEKGRFVEYLFGISVCKVAQDLWHGVLVSSGCFSMFRTKELKAIGGFPQRSMAEDMDVTWLFLEKGKKVKLVSEALCYPLDPHNYRTYRNQVLRWYRAFLQNIAIHKLSLLKNRRAFLFAFWNLIAGLSILFNLAILIYLVCQFEWIAGLLFLGVQGAGFLLAAVFAYLKARDLGKGSLAIKSLPSYLVTTSVNSYLFMVSVWLEWVRRKRLTVWQKGH